MLGHSLVSQTLCLPRHNSLPVRFILPPLASSVGTTIRRSRKIDTFPDFSLENGNSSTIPSSLQWTNIGLHSPFDRLCLLNISPVSKLLDRLFLPVLCRPLVLQQVTRGSDQSLRFRIHAWHHLRVFNKAIHTQELYQVRHIILLTSTRSPVLAVFFEIKFPLKNFSLPGVRSPLFSASTFPPLIVEPGFQPVPPTPQKNWWHQSLQGMYRASSPHPSAWQLQRFAGSQLSRSVLFALSLFRLPKLY